MFWILFDWKKSRMISFVSATESNNIDSSKSIKTNLHQHIDAFTKWRTVLALQLRFYTHTHALPLSPCLSLADFFSRFGKTENPAEAMFSKKKKTRKSNEQYEPMPFAVCALNLILNTPNKTKINNIIECTIHTQNKTKQNNAVVFVCISIYQQRQHVETTWNKLPLNTGKIIMSVRNI